MQILAIALVVTGLVLVTLFGVRIRYNEQIVLAVRLVLDSN
jgi:hypothetical protein